MPRCSLGVFRDIRGGLLASTHVVPLGRITTAPERARHRYTFAEYLAVEADSGMKHEYDDGEIVAMAGGPLRHNELAAAMTAALYAGRKSGCRVFQSDQRVRILATGKATYPDVSMVCGPIELDPADPTKSTITK